MTAATLLGNTYDKLEMYKEAAPYLTIAADAGDSDSQLALGLMYYRGDGVTKNLQLALKYSKEYLIATDNPVIQGVVGGIYYELGGADNFKKSYEYFTLSAKRGNAQAYAHLGLMYLFGKYVEKDVSKTKEYLDIGINNNVSFATYTRGLMYENGFEEEVNPSKAMELYKRAAELGNIDAQQQLSELKIKYTNLK